MEGKEGPGGMSTGELYVGNMSMRMLYTQASQYRPDGQHGKP